MTCAHCRDAQDFFGDRMARHELRRYRRRGPRKTTRMLLERLREGEVRGRSLLDIGGGVGALQHELLADGLGRVINVDAAPAYQAAVEREAASRGTLDRIDFRSGDFVELAGEVPAADLVTLDRVVCCYPDMPALVGASAARARKLYGLVFPREVWWTRIGVRVLNLWQRIRGSDFRVYVHPHGTLQATVAKEGLSRVYSGRTLNWQVMLFERP